MFVVESYQEDKTGASPLFIGYLGYIRENFKSFTQDINKAHKFEKKEDCPVSDLERWDNSSGKMPLHRAGEGYYRIKDITPEKDHNIPGVSNNALNLIIRKKTLWAEIKSLEQEYARVRKQIKVFEDDCRDISFRIQKKMEESQEIADKLLAMEYEGLKLEDEKLEMKEMKQKMKEVVILPDSKIRGRDLIFVSWIKRDGTGTEPVKEDMSYWNDKIFTLNCLSLTERTYIASEFNSYVVRLKSQEQNLFNND